MPTGQNTTSIGKWKLVAITLNNESLLQTKEKQNLYTVLSITRHNVCHELIEIYNVDSDIPQTRQYEQRNKKSQGNNINSV